MAQLEVRRLGPEPWGRRLERARAANKLTFRAVEDALYPHVSKSAVVRLERLEAAPSERRERARAALLVALYGFALDDFDLHRDDLPPAIDRRALARTGRRASSTKWYLTAAAA